MTGEQIVKACEGLTPIQQLNLYRNLYYKDGNATERGIVANAINALLTEYNRQNEEIEELQGTLKFVRGTVARLLETSDKQQAKIENLKQAYAVYEETTGLKQARAEAIREFAERLKLYLFIERGGISTVSGKDIDKLVKEMTEGQI